MGEKIFSKSACGTTTPSGAREIRHCPSTEVSTKSRTRVLPEGCLASTPLALSSPLTSMLVRNSPSLSRGTVVGSPEWMSTRVSGFQVAASCGVRYWRATE